MSHMKKGGRARYILGERVIKAKVGYNEAHAYWYWIAVTKTRVYTSGHYKREVGAQDGLKRIYDIKPWCCGQHIEHADLDILEGRDLMPVIDPMTGFIVDVINDSIGGDYEGYQYVQFEDGQVVKSSPQPNIHYNALVAITSGRRVKNLKCPGESA